MDSQKYEGAIFKMACEYFGEAILPFFGINDKIASVGPTEISLLTISKKYLDFTFLTTADQYLHFEFQSTNGGIRNAAYIESYGINTYRTIPIYMADKDADQILAYLKSKKGQGTPFTDNDFVQLALCPVMNSRYSAQERIMDAVKLLKFLPEAFAELFTGGFRYFNGQITQAGIYAGYTKDIQKINICSSRPVCAKGSSHLSGAAAVRRVYGSKKQPNGSKSILAAFSQFDIFFLCLIFFFISTRSEKILPCAPV